MDQPSPTVIEIVEVAETIYFGHHEGQLCQWLWLTLANLTDTTLEVDASVLVGSAAASTHLRLDPGVRMYRAHGPCLWPSRGPVENGRVVVEGAGCRAEGRATLGSHQPWTVYLISETCSDYIWRFTSEEEYRADEADLTAVELDYVKATLDGPPARRNHYNFVVGREIDYFLEKYPERSAELWEAARRGDVWVNPFPNMSLTLDMSAEGLFRHFYRLRRYMEAGGFNVRDAHHQETPTIAWGLVGILADLGILRLAKAVYNYECPSFARLTEPPIFLWEGPDGQRLLMRRHVGTYYEGSFVVVDNRAVGQLADVRRINTRLHTKLGEYEALGDRYPFSVASLLGTYGDLSPLTKGMPQKKIAGVDGYNDQGWEYPRLVNATHTQFWDAVEREIAERGIDVPVVRGDFGTTWEVWPATTAAIFGSWRRSQAQAQTADAIAAIASRLAPQARQGFKKRLDDAWESVDALADHAWNGAYDLNRQLNAALRRGWADRANRGFERVIDEGMRVLCSSLEPDLSRRVIVFNSLGWVRSGSIAIRGGPGSLQIEDAETGVTMPSDELIGANGVETLFRANEVPAFGYRAYRLRAAPPALECAVARESDQPSPWSWDGETLDGPWYRLQVDQATGAIRSLWHKRLGWELVDPERGYGLNEASYLSDGVAHRPRLRSATLVHSGHVCSRLVLRSSLKNADITTTVVLYTETDLVELVNDVHKVIAPDICQLDFVFPFAVPGGRFRYESPGAIIDPSTDQRPGAAQSVHAVRSFVDVSNETRGITLAPLDSGIVQFGHRSSREDPVTPDSRTTIFALVLHDQGDTEENTRDQAGDEDFSFRFAVFPHDGPFGAEAAVHAGWEASTAIVAQLTDGGDPLASRPGRGRLPPSRGFLAVTPSHAVPMTLKIAEDSGYVVRLWEVAGTAVEAAVDGAGLDVAYGRSIDPIERDRGPLPGSGGSVRVPVRALGIASVRLT